ncbi:MAG: hypothetical protein AAFY26_08300 [Cyanobacteria bacterium J06638_22]
MSTTRDLIIRLKLSAERIAQQAKAASQQVQASLGQKYSVQIELGKGYQKSVEAAKQSIQRLQATAQKGVTFVANTKKFVSDVKYLGSLTLSVVKQSPRVQFATNAVQVANRASEAFKKLRTAGGGAAKFIGSEFLSVSSRITQFANSVNEISDFFGKAVGAARGFYQATIGANEELNQLILSSQASLVATNRVFQGGVEIEDSSEAIAALEDRIRGSLDTIRKNSLSLVGVTSRELVPLFQILSTQSSNLANQSREVPDAIGAAELLTTDFAAALGTIPIPLEQARQEINSILTGQINSDSQLAKSLGLNNAMVEQWKAQGVLVDQLRERLEPFVAGNRAAAESISGYASNVLEIFQETLRIAGEPLYERTTEALSGIYELINTDTEQGRENVQKITEFALAASDELLTFSETTIKFFRDIGREALPGIVKSATALWEITKLVVDGWQAFYAAVQPLLPLLGMAMDFLGDTSELLIDTLQTAQTGVGYLTGGFRDAQAAIEANGRAVSELGQQSVARLQDITQAQRERNTAIAEGRELTDEELNQERLLIQIARDQIAANEAKANELRNFVDLGNGQNRIIELQIAELERHNEALRRNVDGLAEQAGGIEIVSNQTNLLNEVTVERERITRETSEQILAQMQREINGAQTQAETQSEIARINREALEEQIALIQQKLAIAEAGSEDEKQLRMQLHDLEMELGQVELDAIRSAQQERIDEIERANQAAERAIDNSQNEQIQAIRQAQLDRTKTEAEAEAEIAQIRDTASRQHIQRIRDEIASIQAMREEGLIGETEALDRINQLEDQRSALNLQRIEDELAAQQQAADRRIAEVERANAAELRAIEAQQNAETLAIRQAQLRGDISREEAEQQLRDMRSQTIEHNIRAKEREIEATQQLLADGLIAEEEAIAQIETLRNDLNALTIDNIEEELEAREEAFDREMDMLQQKAQLEADRQTDLLDGRSGDLSLYNDLLSAQEDLLNAQQESASAAMDRQIAQAEREGDSVRAERLRLEAIEQQGEFLEQQLRLANEQRRISQEQRAIDLDRQRIQAETALLEAKIALIRAQNNGASQQEIANLQRIVDLQYQNVDLADRAIAQHSQVVDMENEAARLRANNQRAEQRHAEAEQRRAIAELGSNGSGSGDGESVSSNSNSGRSITFESRGVRYTRHSTRLSEDDDAGSGNNTAPRGARVFDPSAGHAPGWERPENWGQPFTLGNQNAIANQVALVRSGLSQVSRLRAPTPQPLEGLLPDGSASAIGARGATELQNLIQNSEQLVNEMKSLRADIITLANSPRALTVQAPDPTGEAIAILNDIRRSEARAAKL